MTGGRRAALVIAAYALLASIVFPVYPHFVSPNELTRWLLTASAVDRGTIEVTSLVPVLGPRFEDLSEAGGRLYSNKAPGVAFLAVPGYLAVRALTGPAGADNIRPAIVAMRLCASTIPLLLLAWLFMRLGRRFGIDAQRTAFVVFALLFATPLFAYGLLLFSHALAAAAVFGAWALLFGFEEGQALARRIDTEDAPRSQRPAPSGGGTRKQALIAGALLGIAVLSEYPVAVAAAVLIAALAVRREWSSIVRVIAGGLPFAIVLGIYDWVAFGSPLRLSTWYDRLPEYRALGRSALFGVGLPSPETLLRLLLDPGRGLIVFSPLLLFSIPALAAARRRMTPAAWWTLVLLPASIFLVYAGYPNWHGGWTAGPRYVVAAIPFLVFALLFRSGGIVEALAAGWSTCAVALTSLVFPFVPNDFPLPWGSLAMPLLRHDLIVPNALHFVARPLAVVVPLLIVAIAGALVMLRIRGAVAVAGVILAIVAGSQWPRFANPTLIGLQRAYVADVYFEQSGELERFAGPDNVPPGLLRRRAFERTLPPASWPF